MITPALFKVLGPNGESIHGGTGTWPLPIDGQPGEWVDCGVQPQCCTQGLHVVSDPLRWWKPQSRLFLVEADFSDYHGDNTEKVAVRRCRTLSEVMKDTPWIVCFPRVRAFLAASLRSFDKTANLADANLADANLADANLADANLAGANLARAYLVSANLARANLAGAYLAGAYLADANLARANLAGAYLAGANLADAKYTKQTVWPIGFTIPTDAILID